MASLITFDLEYSVWVEMSTFLDYFGLYDKWLPGPPSDRDIDGCLAPLSDIGVRGRMEYKYIHTPREIFPSVGGRLGLEAGGLPSTPVLRIKC